jgi:hypothetical protein
MLKPPECIEATAVSGAELLLKLEHRRYNPSIKLASVVRREFVVRIRRSQSRNVQNIFFQPKERLLQTDLVRRLEIRE